MQFQNLFMKHADIKIERCQLIDEGRDIREVEEEFDRAVGLIHRRWDEKFSHHWCHAISNAQIVALGLLWGEGEFEKSICRAVQASFDTDCNGATVGSLIGMMLGAKRLPEKWIKPLNNKLETGLAGYNLVEIDGLAEEGFDLYKRLRNS